MQYKTFLFSADFNNQQLWITDGTDTGTHLLRSFITMGMPVALNGKIYFSATESGDVELWTSDGTIAGTLQLVNINASTSSLPKNLTAYDNKLVFSAIDGTNGRELWISDGTTAGTFKPQFPNATHSDPIPAGDNPFFEYNGNLYLNAYYDNAGYELWKFDLLPTQVKGIATTEYSVKFTLTR